MEIEFDAAKNQTNIAKHGIDLHLAGNFEWDGAVVNPDERRNYGESRFIAVGFIGTRHYVMIFTIRSGNLRVISLRKANGKERKRYAEKRI